MTFALGSQFHIYLLWINACLAKHLNSLRVDPRLKLYTEDGEGNLDIPVSEDSYQIEGQGDVEVRLGEESSAQHRYQISRGRDGEVNIEVVVGEADTQPGTDTDIVIDNTDYNYTLIISGENIQVTLYSIPNLLIT